MDTSGAQIILAEALQREAGLLGQVTGSTDVSEGHGFLMAGRRRCHTRTRTRTRTRPCTRTRTRTCTRVHRTRTTGLRCTTCRVNRRRIRLLSQETKQRHRICVSRKHHC